MDIILENSDIEARKQERERNLARYGTDGLRILHYEDYE